MDVVALGFIQIKKEYKWNNWETIQVIAFDFVYTVFEVFYSDGATIGTQITTKEDLDGDCFFLCSHWLHSTLWSGFHLQNSMNTAWKNSSMSS